MTTDNNTTYINLDLYEGLLLRNNLVTDFIFNSNNFKVKCCNQSLDKLSESITYSSND